MTDIDKAIREAMTSEDREWFDRLGEPSLPMQVIESFRTRSALMIVWAILGGIVLTIACIYSGIKLYQASETHELIRWTVVFFTAFLLLSALKFWYWLELQKNSLVREIKRLELQVAKLAQREKAGE